MSVQREAAIYRVAERLWKDWLEEKIAGPGPDGSDRKCRIIGSGQDDKRGVGTLQAQLVKEIKRPHLGVIEIQA